MTRTFYCFLILCSFLMLDLTGCGLISLPKEYKWDPEALDPDRLDHRCKIRAYIDSDVSVYLRSRNYAGIPVRLAIFPFDVPAAFAGNTLADESLGTQLSNEMMSELLSVGDFPTVEFFNREVWQGKRDEFFTGNHEALRLARDAGYGFALLGYLEPMEDTKSLRFYTKVIDTTYNITLYYGETIVKSDRPIIRKILDSAAVTDRDLITYDFGGRVHQYVQCTVEHMLRTDSR